MALRGPTFFPVNSQTDTPPAGIYDLKSSTAVTLATASMSGTTSGATIKQIWPTSTASTVLQSATVAAVAQNNNKGWWISPTTDMASTSTVNRVLPPSSAQNYKVSVTATGLAGNDTVTMSFFKRSSGGVNTFLANVTGTAANGAVGTTTLVTMTPTSAAVDLVFAAGETMYIELYLTIATQTLAAGTAVVTLNNTTSWTLNSPNGIISRTLSSINASSSFSGLIQNNVGVNRAASIVMSAAKAVQLFVFKNASISLDADDVKNVVLNPKSTSISLIGQIQKNVSLLSKQASISLLAAKRVLVNVNKAAAIVANASFLKFITKNISATISLTPNFAKFINLSRKFSAAITSSASAVFGLSQAILQRFSGGATTIYKKIIAVFDD